MSIDAEARLCGQLTIHEPHPWTYGGHTFSCSGATYREVAVTQDEDGWLHFGGVRTGRGSLAGQLGGEFMEQPLPVPNDGPSCHDLVVRDILSRDVQWDLSVGNARHLRDQVADDLDKRKQLGLERYGSLLQPDNGRDFLRDLYEELMDAACYARGRLYEQREDSNEYLILFEIYDDLVSHLVRVKRLQVNAATE